MYSHFRKCWSVLWIVSFCFSIYLWYFILNIYTIDLWLVHNPYMTTQVAKKPEHFKGDVNNHSTWCEVLLLSHCIINHKPTIPLVLQYENVPSNFTLLSLFLFPLDTKQERKWGSIIQRIERKRKCRKLNQIMTHVNYEFLISSL